MRVEYIYELPKLLDDLINCYYLQYFYEAKSHTTFSTKHFYKRHDKCNSKMQCHFLAIYIKMNPHPNLCRDKKTTAKIWEIS